MFVRVKKIKGNEYLYVVENSWKNGKVKQKVRKYIGRVYPLKRVKDEDFYSFHNIEDINKYLSKSAKDIVKDILKFELGVHGFEFKPGKGKEDIMKKEELIVDLSRMRVKGYSNDIALRLNKAGYIYGESIKEIIEFKAGRDKEKSGLELAKLFAGMGIEPDKNIFIRLILGKDFKVDEYE
ncbi:hypothetical protein KY330_01300 [Candidatus Woesearchaeota archaeon]|nr:hypothetical protein [Candidatus Woesearchaeota archaeon]